MPLQLSIDAGSTSLGWCLFQTDKDGEPVALLDTGVRIFSDGRDDKTKEPLAVSRRNARAIRRNLDRRDIRQKRLMKVLIEGGLMPPGQAERKALESLDPYELRARALNEEISLYHLGRALFHINQRRGFKSNRRTDRRENDMGAMKRAIEDLKLKLENSQCRTLGEYLHKKIQKGENARVRASIVKGKAEYDFYPDRDMTAQELDAILGAQRAYHPGLTDGLCETIKKEILHQRPLKPVEVGFCRFEPTERRARLALPEVQQFRIWQEVNNLELEQFKEGDPALTDEERRKLAAELAGRKKMTFGQIRTFLKLPRDCRFNLESDRRPDLKGNETAALLSASECFGQRWSSFTPDEQNELVDLLFSEPDHEELVIRLMNEWDLDIEQAEKVAAAPLQDGFGRVSLKAIRNILPELRHGHKYAEACARAGYHHSDDRTGEVFNRLPYYGEILPESVIGGTFAENDKDNPEKYFGKVNNPTVHIVLNQIRKLVNAVIERHGMPDDIVIELARDLKEPREDIIREQTRNTTDNERINKELEKLGVKQNYANRMLYKLWEDLCPFDPAKRCCPFSGIQIAPHEIFSGQFEEEHLLPFSRSYNDGRANKVLSHRDWNRRKGSRSPFEAFGHEPYWDDILARVDNLPKNKRWRFQPDCWEIAKGEGEDIIARTLNDTRYMSRMAKKYLSAVLNNEKGRNRVRAIPGQMTSLLRDKWGLNGLIDEVWRAELDALFPDKPQLVDMLVEQEEAKKNRMHHLHHAVDAFVAGCTTQGMLQHLSKAAREVESKPDLWEKRKKLVTEMPEPFEGFRDQLRARLHSLVISHKPDHGGARQAIAKGKTIAALHEQTAYGLIRSGEKAGTAVMATRKPLESFTSWKHLELIADLVIREKLKDRLASCSENSAEWRQALQAYREETGTRRLRVHIEKTLDVLVPVNQPEDRGPEATRGKAYKYYAGGGNYCAEIWCPDKGKKAGEWQCEIIPNHAAHRRDFAPVWKLENPAARLVMRLHIDDMVAYDENGVTKICRVKKMTSGMIYVRDHRIALEQADKLSWAASAKQLQLKNARKISVDILGHVKDPRRKTGLSDAAE